MNVKRRCWLLILRTCGSLVMQLSQTALTPKNIRKLLRRDNGVLLIRSWLKSRFSFFFFAYQLIINTKNLYCCRGGTNVWQANICQLVAIFHPVITLDRSCSPRRRCCSLQQWNKANSFGCLIIAIANQGWHTEGSEAGADNLPLSRSLVGLPLSLALSTGNSWDVKLLARFSGQLRSWPPPGRFWNSRGARRATP